MKHDNLKHLTGESWIWPLGRAFDIFKKDIIPVLKAEEEVFPNEQNIFRAFKEVPFDNVRVVILGQDPYHDGSATGVAFDNPKTKKPSPSLRNILKEIESDTGELSSEKNVLSYLEHLLPQGVLLLNTALTVLPGKPESHLELWRPFTEEVIKTLNTKSTLIWVLWGKKAQKYKPQINPKHHIIEGAHPSPFSAKKFFGSKPFSQINKILKSPIKF